MCETRDPVIWFVSASLLRNLKKMLDPDHVSTSDKERIR